jgi:hypothetical protein
MRRRPILARIHSLKILNAVCIERLIDCILSKMKDL